MCLYWCRGAKSLLVIFSFLIFSSCEQKMDAKKLREYILSVQGAPPSAGAGNNGSPSTPPDLGISRNVGKSAKLHGGIPFSHESGSCGDGVINGPDGEHCDKGALPHTNCKSLGGIGGDVYCSEDCHLDISDCITPAVDAKLAGAAETCKCACEDTACRGGCVPAGATTMSKCDFRCDNDCVCNCEGKMEAHVEECEFSCLCDVTASGAPDCNCNITQCEILAIIGPNIATKVAEDQFSKASH